MEPVTKEVYERLAPYTQGYVSYLQSKWNEAIPAENIYTKGTEEYKNFDKGYAAGILDDPEGIEAED